MKRNVETPPTDDQNQSVDHNVTKPPVVEPEPNSILCLDTDHSNRNAEILEDGSIRLSGRVLYDGGGNISELDFFSPPPCVSIDMHPIPRIEANGTMDGLF